MVTFPVRVMATLYYRKICTGLRGGNIRYISTLPDVARTLEDRIAATIDGAKMPQYRVLLRTTVDNISRNPTIIELLNDKYFVGEPKWKNFCYSYRRRVVKDPRLVLNGKEIIEFMNNVEAVFESDGADRQGLQNIVTQNMLRNVEIDLASEIASARTLFLCSDLRIPHEWYAPARLMKRKIIFHGGPTNSGKTYHALKRLREADPSKGGGLYCGPLRLLALEVYDNLNRQGIYCNLITGQEKRLLPFYSHTSCTVEVANLHTPYDVAVIDEIQMIADKSRGYAWTRALLGLCAREIHVCGGDEAADIVRQLAANTGDSFELKTYERLSELRVQDKSLCGDYSQIQPGDCVVAFSKADIFSIKREIERLTDHKCCVVYGELPPETRSGQARLFNDEGTGYDVLVASDAIGMGLNLNIRRIIFHTTVKPSYGTQRRQAARHMDITSIKQIAGRAGRLSSQYEYGEVTTWQEQDLAYLKSVIHEATPQIKAAGIFPSVDQVDLFSRHLLALAGTGPAHSHDQEEDEEGENVVCAGRLDDVVENVPLGHHKSGEAEMGAKEISSVQATMRLSAVVERFMESSRTTGQYFLCDHDPLIITANWLNSIPMSLPDRFVFGTAPVSLRDGLSPRMLYHFAAMYALGRPVPLDIRFASGKPTNVLELSDLCAKHNVIDLYLWLAIRYPKHFVERERCLEMKEYALSIIQETLHNTKLQHQYSHSDNYRKVRQTVESTLGGLPAAVPHQIRLRMADHLGKIEADQWMVFPNEARSGEQTARDSRDSSEHGKKRNHNYKRERVKNDKFSKRPWQSPEDRVSKKNDMHLRRIVAKDAPGSKKIIRSHDGKSFKVYRSHTPTP